MLDHPNRLKRNKPCKYPPYRDAIAPKAKTGVNINTKGRFCNLKNAANCGTSTIHTNDAALAMYQTIFSVRLAKCNEFAVMFFPFKKAVLKLTADVKEPRNTVSIAKIVLNKVTVPKSSSVKVRPK